MQNKVVIHGFHAVGTRLKRFPDSVIELYLNSTRMDQRAKDLPDWLKRKAARCCWWMRRGWMA